MKRLSTAVDDIRLDRKRFSISGSLLPFLLLSVMLVTQTSARSVTENEKLATATTISKTQIRNERAQQQQQQQPQKNDALYNDENNSADLTFDDGDEYADVDNVEWHHVKIVDGIMHEDHPIIMYKEDFVSEDYDPNKHNSNSEQANQQRRKYKNIKRQKRLNRTDEQTATYASTSEKYHALKPEKIYFDILPQAPVALTDDSSSNDSKFDPSRIRVEVISLLDDEKNSSKMPEDNDDEPSKQLLNKRSKKYHHQHHHQRKRRDLTAVEANTNDEQNVHVIKKRNPNYRYPSPGANSFDVYNKHWNNWVQKHPVAGNHWNGIDGDVPEPPPIQPFGFDNRFGGESNTDRVIWGKAPKKTKPANKPASKPTQRPTTTTAESIFHNSNPEDADFSVFNKNKNNNNNNNNNNGNRHPQNNNRIPNNNRHPVNQRPNNIMRQPSTQSPVRPTTSAPPVQQNRCVYAILQCCSTSDSNIRYECFERFGCLGAFWNLNPCADNVKDSVTDYFDQMYNKDDYDS